MPTFTNGGLSLHYEAHGDGTPVLFLHGGAVSFEFNYARAGWIERATSRGLKVLGLDFRGHGQSDKPLDPQAYGTEKLAGDALALLDHLDLPRAAIVAYSLGTAVALQLLRHAPGRVTKAALMATGDGLIGHPPHTFEETMPGLVAVLGRSEYPRDLPRHLAAYWNFVEATGTNREAMLALARAKYPPISAAQAAEIKTPVLVVSGARDPVLGRGPRLAQALGRGEYLEVADADHFSLATLVDVQDRVSAFVSDNAGDA